MSKTNDRPVAVDEFIPTRWSLLSRLKNLEDQDSWQVFFNTYWRLIYSVALKAGLSGDAAQDVVQETVLTVSRNLPRFRTDPSAGSFKGWLMNITRWRIADQYRRAHRGQVALVSATDDTSSTPLIERIADPAAPEWQAIWDEEWEKNRLETAIEAVKKQVTARQYQIFDLYVLKQWPVGEVARALHVSAGQVYLAKHRISRLIKKQILKFKTSPD
jgi:RNA polymerase sigma factor (sigma-70 family)